MATQDEIKFLNAPNLGRQKKKYCRFKKLGIKYIDYKDPNFLLKFVNDQGKILPRRITGNSLKFQRKITSIKTLGLSTVPVLAIACGIKAL